MFFIIAFVVLSGVAFSIVLGAVFACHAGHDWLRRKIVRGEFTASPSLMIVVAIWLAAVAVTVGSETWRGWEIGAYQQETSLLTFNAEQEALRIATDQGEVVPRGPVFQAEYAARLNKVWQTPHPAAQTSPISNLIFPLWIVCGAVAGGYYLFVLQRSWGWLPAAGLAPILAAAQFFVIGTGTVILSIVGYFALGGIE